VFFFQAEDGIRDFHVTGVQTCALPICSGASADSTCSGASALTVRERRVRRAGAVGSAGAVCSAGAAASSAGPAASAGAELVAAEIGRASCRAGGGAGGVSGRTTRTPPV